MKHGLCILLTLLFFFLKEDSSNGMPNKSLGLPAGGCMMMDASHVVITPADCQSTDGSIIGLSSTGTVGKVTYTWYDVVNSVVSTTADLVNAGPGTYVVILKDGSYCPPVQMTFTIDPKNKVVFDNSTTIITASDCSSPTGSITNISLTNAVLYRWVNNSAGYNVVGTSKDLTGVKSGIYTLYAYNPGGCFTTQDYVVPNTAYVPAITKIDVELASCAAPGAITLTFNSLPDDPIYKYSYTNQNGPQAGALIHQTSGPTQITLNGIAPDVNTFLTLSDPSGCVTTLGPFKPGNGPGSEIDTSKMLVHNDVCGQSIGVIINLVVNGGGKYDWTDAATGKSVGGALYLAGVPAGTYILTVTQSKTCSFSQAFVITDSTSVILPPTLDNVSQCLPGDAIIRVNNPIPGDGYILYDSTKTFVSANKFGLFQVKVAHTSTWYVSQTFGTCESSETPVTVSVTAPGVNIPNTFTPNNDSVNDYWDITGLAQFPGVEVDVFDRAGQLVFHSVGYGKPFDGQYNNKQLPSGVYYYTIDVKRPDCLAKISGNLTIIR